MKDKHYIIVAIILLIVVFRRKVLAALPSGLTNSLPPEIMGTGGDSDRPSFLGMGTISSVRNNNPGNIRKSGTKWKGSIESAPNTDSRFVIFQDWIYGIRAMILNLRSYFTKHNINTIRGIVNRWAPPSENQTSSYVYAVSQWTGIDPDKVLTFNRETIGPIVLAMSRMEAGKPVMSLDQFNKAFDEI